MTETRFLTMPDGRRIAHRYVDGRSPALVFLPGYMSDMAGGKAQAVFEWAAANGQACLLLDYSGCGESPGDFADGTLSRWREEVLAAVGAHCSGEVVFIGSSMGGWLMLLCALAMPERVAGLIGIAPAPDFTEWGFSEEQKAIFRSGGTVYEENMYGPEPTPTHAGLWADGENLRLLHAEILEHGHAVRAGDPARGTAQQVGVDTAPDRVVVDRHLCQHLPHGVGARHMLGQKCFIAKVFLHQHGGQGGQAPGIGTGPHPQPVVRLGGKAGGRGLDSYR